MAIKRCVICGKEFIDYGRGKYCSGPHYKTCVVCGKEFEYDPSGPEPIVCSHTCGGKRVRQNSTYREKECLRCGKHFTPTSGRQKYCSAECRESKSI